MTREPTRPGFCLFVALSCLSLVACGRAGKDAGPRASMEPGSSEGLPSPASPPPEAPKEAAQVETGLEGNLALADKEEDSKKTGFFEGSDEPAAEESPPPEPKKKAPEKPSFAKLDAIAGPGGDAGVELGGEGGAGSGLGGLGTLGRNGQLAGGRAGSGERPGSTQPGAARATTEVHNDLTEKARDLDGVLHAARPDQPALDAGAPLDAEDLKQEIGALDEVALDPTKPERFLARSFYFENTYLGGNAAHAEQLRRLDAALPSEAPRPYRTARAYPQHLDAPSEAGIALSATLHTSHLDQPGRVILQVGLQGSHRYGWRRPPLDLVVVLEGGALGSAPAAVLATIEALLSRLGPQDRLGVVVMGGPAIPLRPATDLRAKLSSELASGARGPGHTMRAALQTAGRLLLEAAGDESRVPGTQTVLLLTSGSGAGVAQARAGAHELTVQGAVTSVVEVGRSEGAWWSVAAAGHGNYHFLEGAGDAARVVDEELGALSRVVARLLRVNVRLAEGVQAVRILGSRVLQQDEVRRVKAREEAVDAQLSKTLGVKADRGEDDDGIQTVIPYFYGGDAHVVLIELWVEQPGPIADVSLRYKDMVRLSNARAQTSVSIGARPRPLTPGELLVRRNVLGSRLAEHLADASAALTRNDVHGAQRALELARALAARTGEADRRLVADFEAMIDRGQWRAQTAAALSVASKRKLGEPAPSGRRDR